MVMYDSRLPRLTEMTQKIFNTVGSSKNKRNAVFRNMDQTTGNLRAASDFIFRTLDRVTNLHFSAPWTDTEFIVLRTMDRVPDFAFSTMDSVPSFICSEPWTKTQRVRPKSGPEAFYSTMDRDSELRHWTHSALWLETG